MNSPISPILTLKLVVMATSLDHRKKGQNWQSTIKYLPYGENLMKIGPVDPEIILLKGLFFKKERKLDAWQSPA